jgi:hypothetical protein
MNADQGTAVLLATAAGILASASTELVNRLTPGTKLSPTVLRLLVMGFVVLLVVTFAALQAAGKPIAWEAVGAQTLAAWLIALGTHDAASPPKN